MHSLRQPAGKARDTPISFLNKKKNYKNGHITKRLFGCDGILGPGVEILT